MTKIPNWDALAPYWHCFENIGFNKTILNLLEKYLVMPILYVGGGRGTYPAYLATRFGKENITVVDLSPAMACRAYSDFQLEYLVGDVRNLPLPKKFFGSVICASGVLEFLDLSEQEKSLREMARVCRQDGSILITAFYCDHPENDKSLNISCDSQPINQKQNLLDLWFKHYDLLSSSERRLVASFSAVAREMKDRVAAYQLLHNSLPAQGGYILLEDFPSIANIAGLESELLKLFVEQSVMIWRLSQVQLKTELRQ